MIPLKDMVPGIWYKVVTNGSTLFKGDTVKLDPKDNSIICAEAGGWLLKEDWKRLRNKVEINREYYKRKTQSLESEIEKIKELLR
jgi:hypothetical protein